MVKKKTYSYVALHIGLILFSFILLLPFVSLLSTSFKTFEEALANPAKLIPNSLNFENYKKVITEQNYFSGFFTSLQIAMISSIGTVFSASLVAYAFARFDVREKNVIFSILMMSAMIPGQVLQISMYEMYVNIGWMNTYLPFWIPPFLGGGIMNVFLIRQFFMGMPKVIYEAAEIDGASEFKQYTTIALRLSIPVLLTVFIMTFTGSWNDFMSPLLYLNNMPDNKLPLALLMYNMYDRLKIGDNKCWNIISAGNILMMLPIVLLFFGTQKYFIEGINVSGIKQ